MTSVRATIRARIASAVERKRLGGVMPLPDDEPTDLETGRWPPDMRESIRIVLVNAFERSELTIAQLAIRTGLSRRTIERVLAGDTCELTTVERVAMSLRVVLVDPGEGVMRGPPR